MVSIKAWNSKGVEWSGIEYESYRRRLAAGPDGSTDEGQLAHYRVGYERGKGVAERSTTSLRDNASPEVFESIQGGLHDIYYDWAETRDTLLRQYGADSEAALMWTGMCDGLRDGAAVHGIRLP